MSFSQPRHPDRVDDQPEAAPAAEAAALLELLDADHTQTILAETRVAPWSARALADACGASRATIYRRLNRLEDARLVESSMRYDADGHHRTVYEATLESITVDVTEDGYALSVTTSTGASAAADPPRLRSSD
jgi:predicted transcriptional regulator